ncbi:S8 family peptidase [Cohaesibacter celericrescens]|uniref:Peptidase S8/S53 domain-containing protein n=1 Tax=Cohaesibacter celericrescens TaxID=2067669 RepID=A0A2N5XW52_9HYPH|nr:S8 family serine peptidase [Cohaesibacter celericrescens]PLW78731.1 hypothetical protein C0081_00325 [Cohaesibacter celericrescens]
MKRTGFAKSACALLACLLVMTLGSADQARAQYPDTYPDQDDSSHSGGSGRILLPAIGLGISIIREVSRQKQIKEQEELQRPAAQRPRVSKKRPNRKPRKTRDNRSSRKAAPRIVLPETLRVARAKPRIYSIDGKPWSSDKEFVVVLQSGLSEQAVSEFLAQFDLEVIDQTRINLLDQVVLKLAYPAEMSPQQALLMATDERVYRAQPDYFYYPATEGDAEPTDMLEGLQYAFDKMGFAQLSGEESGLGVKLAVVDSGIKFDHPSLSSSVTDRFTAFPEADSAQLNRDHGTAVASIIAAHAGMRGVAKNVALMSAQVFRFSDKGHMVADSYDIVRGIDWAVENGAEILNLSFAGSKDKFLQDALGKAEEKGVIVVAAAGNEGPDAPAAYPAAYENVIAVTATDEDDGLYIFANRGDHVELAAPGVDVLVAAGEDGYGLQTGTSMATAYISGSIALMLEKEPELTVQDIKGRLARSVLDLGMEGRDPDFGYGRLDAYKALTSSSQPELVN